MLSSRMKYLLLKMLTMPSCSTKLYCRTRVCQRHRRSTYRSKWRWNILCWTLLDIKHLTKRIVILHQLSPVRRACVAGRGLARVIGVFHDRGGSSLIWLVAMEDGGEILRLEPGLITLLPDAPARPPHLRLVE